MTSNDTLKSNHPGVAVVTGGAKGIGRAISEQLVRDGYSVAVAGRDGDALTLASSQLNEIGSGRAYPLQLDVTNTGSINDAFAEVSRELGSVSVLVNCAGIIVRGPSEQLSDDDWDRVVSTGLSGAFRCSRAVYSEMAERGNGAIVNIGSVGGSGGISGRAAYTASKAGLEGLTRTLAVEWAAKGIRVNTVAPGWTRTEMVAGGIQTGALDEQALCRRIPQGRLADPVEIAYTVAFLASSKASYVTGQTLIVDGGVTVNLNA